jgi:hypothetical protein
MAWQGSIYPGLDDQLPGEETAKFDSKGVGSTRNFPIRNTDQYYASLRTDYNYRIISKEPLADQSTVSSPVFYKIEIRIEPCRIGVLTGNRYSNCCDNTNEANCQDNPSIDAGEDMQIAYYQNAHIPTCVGTIFETDPNCGTFIEVHRRKDVTVVSDLPLTKGNTVSGFRSAYIDTTRLCAGDYELWWVVRTRSGPYVQYQKNFKVLSPGCN